MGNVYSRISFLFVPSVALYIVLLEVDYGYVFPQAVIVTEENSWRRAHKRDFGV